MASQTDQSRADTLWIEDAGQLSLGLAPRRQDIVDRLLAFGPASVKELAQQLGARPSALYHHVRLLLEAGLVVVAETRVLNRKREQVYAAPARAIRLRLLLGDAESQAAAQAFVRVLGRQISDDFNLGLARDSARTGGPDRNVGVRRVMGSPDAATLARINRKLEEIDALLIDSRGKPENGVVLSWVIAPLPSGADDAT